MSFTKYEGNPVLGSKALGTCFDVYVTKENGLYRMDFSWRPQKALAVTFSKDGVHWEEPQITLSADETTGWEDRINRNCVLKIGDTYKMWYTGQARGFSFIGYAESKDGLHFERVLNEPVLISERAWEGFSVMNPCVLYENGVYRMWYAAGETYEPNVLAYAESEDGIHWKKSRINPIFTKDSRNIYEQDRIGGCQVIKTVDMGYVMFYIGYENIHKAQICMAHSKNGVTQWEKSPMNPIISPTEGEWDADACYKPSALWNEETRQWMLWYNGRKDHDEFIGMALKIGRNLF
ncbi:MAG: hypothetical protein E7329_07045 [Clostridiales bacterium]|nr:hypothetical protein [Clostridiales bacterium]